MCYFLLESWSRGSEGLCLFAPYVGVNRVIRYGDMFPVSLWRVLLSFYQLLPYNKSLSGSYGLYLHLITFAQDSHEKVNRKPGHITTLLPPWNKDWNNLDVNWLQEYKVQTNEKLTGLRLYRRKNRCRKLTIRKTTFQTITSRLHLYKVAHAIKKPHPVRNNIKVNI